MKSSLSTFATLAVFLAPAFAQQPEWAQCGGIGWNGGTTCASGLVCTPINDFYYQCLKGTGTTTTSSGGTTTTTTQVPGATGLNTLAKAAGKKYFGTAVDNSSLGNSQYLAILGNSADFGQITPANSMKWDSTEPSRGNFQYGNGQAIVDLAKKNGQLIRGHTCVWHNQLPSWVSNGGFNSATLTSIIQTHCSTIVGHWKGQIYAWDVVNEIFNDDGTFRSSVFYNTLGQNFVATAFNAARQADANAKLYINDYNIEASGSKSTAMLNLVKSLKAQGVPIDGIGIQAHLIVGQIPSSMKSNLQAFANLGVEIAITELDIRMTLPSTSALLAQQAKDYQTVINICKSITGCVGVTIWDYTDKYSWVPGTFSGQGAACPWDQNLQKKPAYDGIAQGWIQ